MAHTIRFAAETDATQILDIYAPIVTGTATSFEEVPPTRPEAQRRGVARALYGSLIEILRIQGFINALAGIALPNDASVALHERFGFEPVGVLKDVGFKLTQWHDVGWWALRILQPRDPPDPPKPLPDVWAAGAALMQGDRE